MGLEDHGRDHPRSLALAPACSVASDMPSFPRSAAISVDFERFFEVGRLLGSLTLCLDEGMQLTAPSICYRWRCCGGYIAIARTRLILASQVHCLECNYIALRDCFASRGTAAAEPCCPLIRAFLSF